VPFLCKNNKRFGLALVQKAKNNKTNDLICKNNKTKQLGPAVCRACCSFFFSILAEGRAYGT
jgi:hypothetical protein